LTILATFFTAFYFFFSQEMGSRVSLVCGAKFSFRGLGGGKNHQLNYVLQDRSGVQNIY
jgi:hypothetical protein